MGCARNVSGHRTVIRARQILYFLASFFFVLWFKLDSFGIDWGSPERSSRTPLLTFLIGSTRSSSFKVALDALQEQSVVHWQAVVVVSTEVRLPSARALPPDLNISKRHLLDKRIRFLSLYRGLHGYCAGTIRNFALQFVGTSWVALLDGDDSVSVRYVQELSEEIRAHKEIDLVLFRMFDPTGLGGARFIPPHDVEFVESNYLRMSFAFKRTNSKTDTFQCDLQEDFIFLQNFCYSSGRWCLLSSSVLYFVRGVEPSSDELPRFSEVTKFSLYRWEPFDTSPAESTSPSSTFRILELE